MESFLDALLTLLSAKHLFFLALGVFLGLFVGLLPGLGGLAGLALVLPFLFGMDPGPALAMMIGLTSVTSTSDTFPAVLMGVPGTSASQATVMDGFPLSKQGEATRALSAAFSASLVGGIFGAIVLTGAIFIAKPIILAIGFGEQLMLTFLALTMVGVLTGTNAWKGLASCGIGLLIGAVGTTAITAELRLGFDLLYLTDGIPLTAIGLGMFAMPEIIDLLRTQRTISESGRLGAGWLSGVRDMIRHKWLVLRCSGIGCLVGALPGLGGTVVDWIAYGHVIQTAKDTKKFGKGDIRGVLAPESANNAKEGGALIPTLLFGIPGSASMAILLGGMIVIGVEPGVAIVKYHLDLAYVVIWSIAVANIFGTSASIMLARPIALLTTVRYVLIAPFMIGIIFFAAFQATRDWGDFLALYSIGILALFMKRYGWSRPALLIGFVLSEKVEAGIYQSIQAYGWSFLERPLVIFIFALTMVSLYGALKAKPIKAAPREQPVHQRRNLGGQLAFLAVLAIIPAWALVDSAARPFSASVFPVSAALLTLAFLAVVLANMLLRKEAHSVFFNRELEHLDQPRASLLKYLVWIGAMLGLSYLIGFVFAVFIFLAAFLVIQARLSLGVSALGGAAFLTVLALFGHFLVLEYPHGLLQNFVPMPWPFY